MIAVFVLFVLLVYIQLNLCKRTKSTRNRLTPAHPNDPLLEYMKKIMNDYIENAAKQPKPMNRIPKKLFKALNYAKYNLVDQIFCKMFPLNFQSIEMYTHFIDSSTNQWRVRLIVPKNELVTWKQLVTKYEWLCVEAINNIIQQ